MRSIINILQNDTDLTTLIGGANQIGMSTIGQTKKTPYVVVDQEDGLTTNSFDKDGDLDFIRFTVQSVADLSFTSGTIIGADEVNRLVRAALNYVTPATYDLEVVLRVSIERLGELQENRISNKPQVTKEDDYMLTVRNTLASGIDADAQAFITAAGITDETQKGAINIAVLSLKSQGLYVKTKVCYLFVGGTATSHKFNLVDPRDLDVAFRATFFGGITHNANGADPNGTTGFADIHYDLVSDGDGANTAVAFEVNEVDATIASDFGVFDGTNFWQINPISGGGQYITGSGASGILAINTTSQAFHGMSRRSDTDIEAYKNKVSQGTKTDNQIGNYPTGQPGYLFARNNNGLGGQFFSGRRQSFFWIGEGLSTSEMDALQDISNAFNATLSR